uniref:F-box associated beta-propeller type 1 domain-containing protein n=1 Tax=Manihot esculenta TaxID=3983 RepID=A0A2C9V5Y4_MANES
MPVIEVYSLIAGSWKCIHTTGQKYNIIEKCKEAFVNGVVHFIACEEVEHGESEEMYVLSFGFSNEVFCKFMLPEGFGEEILSVLVFKESTIAIFCLESYSSFECSLWAMKKYGETESWTKLFTKQVEVIPRALGFRRSGELLLDFYRGEIVSYDSLCGKLSITG